MSEDNPFLSLLEKSTDEELFEIIENPDDSDKLLFEAAVEVARKRELISEYQATGLLEGDATVMDYNPNNLEEQDIPYTEKNKIVKEVVPTDVRYRRYGIYMIVLGLLGFFLTYKVSDWHLPLFNYIDYTLSGLAVIGGVISFIIGVVKKNYQSEC